MPDRDEERFERAVANNVRASIAGVAVALPIVVLATFGAAPAAMMAYLIAVTVVLSVMVLRRRLHGSASRP